MGRRSNDCGVRPRSHPRALRQFVDFDYADKLSPEDRAWLADFADRYYGADFRDADPEQWPLEARRERYIAKNATRTDIAAWGTWAGVCGTHDPQLRNEHGNRGGYHHEVPVGPANEPVWHGGYLRTFDPEDETRKNELPDLASTPQYLDDPKYKSARETFRSHLSPARRPTEPEDTPELQRARKRLERIVRREQKLQKP